jgi:hypothetical protein
MLAAMSAIQAHALFATVMPGTPYPCTRINRSGRSDV